jgi:hypothetical protein
MIGLSLAIKLNVMKRYFNLLFVVLFLSTSSLVFADDNRTSLGFTATEKDAFLSEMREMLASIQKIMVGIGTENRKMISSAAHYSGNRMARDTPESIKKKTPLAFKEIGAPTHMMFEELVIRAETDDMGTLAEFTGELMQKCLACHALFKAN